MRALRWAAASLVLLLAGVVGLVAVVLCATLVLLPLGIPLLLVARRLFRTAGQLVVPRAVRHPVDTVAGAMSGAGSRAARAATRSTRTGGKAAQQATKKATKKATDTAATVLPRRSRTARLRRRLHLA